MRAWRWRSARCGFAVFNCLGSAEGLGTRTVLPGTLAEGIRIYACHPVHAIPIYTYHMPFLHAYHSTPLCIPFSTYCVSYLEPIHLVYASHTYVLTIFMYISQTLPATTSVKGITGNHYYTTIQYRTFNSSSLSLSRSTSFIGITAHRSLEGRAW